MIPRKPSGFDNIPQTEAIILSHYVFFGGNKEDAFLLYRPQFRSAKGGLNNLGVHECEQFFDKQEHMDYINAYRKELSKWIFVDDSESDNDILPDTDNGRKERALEKLLHQAMTLVEGNVQLDPETLKTCTDIFKRLGILKEDAQRQEEAPRRYLPVRCYSECRYRLFVESHVANMDIVDTCQFCRTRKFAEEHGWKFESTKNLDVPEEINQKIREALKD